MNTSTKQQLLQQIAAVSAMERGKLSTYSFKERSGANGPYHKLQQWENGKNTTRYVPADEVCQVQAALAGYAQYRQLTEEYAQLVIAETRQKIASKKRADPTGDPPGPGRRNPRTDCPVRIPSPERRFGRSVGDAGAYGRS